MLSLYAFTACESGVGHGHADHSSWRIAEHFFYTPHGFSTVEINVRTVTRVRKHHSYNSTVLTLVKLTGLAVRTAVHSVLWHFWVARTFGHCRWLSGCNHWNGFYAHKDMGSDERRDWETQPEEIVPLVAIVTKWIKSFAVKTDRCVSVLHAGFPLRCQDKDKDFFGTFQDLWCQKIRTILVPFRASKSCIDKKQDTLCPLACLVPPALLCIT